MEKATSRWLVAFLICRTEGHSPLTGTKNHRRKGITPMALGMAKNRNQPYLTLIDK